MLEGAGGRQREGSGEHRAQKDALECAGGRRRAPGGRQTPPEADGGRRKPPEGATGRRGPPEAARGSKSTPPAEKGELWQVDTWKRRYFLKANGGYQNREKRGS